MSDTEKSCVNSNCGTRFPMSAIVCAYCGSDLIVVPKPLIERISATRLILIFAAVVFIAAIVVGGAKYVFNSDNSETKDVPTQSAQSEPPSPTEVPHTDTSKSQPPQNTQETQGSAIASVTPWQFLKNPYMDQGKLIRLDYTKTALVMNGSLITYQRCQSPSAYICHQYGLISLQFNRMFGPHQALFNVIVRNADLNGQGEKQGELLVDVEPAVETPELNFDWIVMPEEPTAATNGYGANITVPTVRFVRYALDGDSPRVP